MSLVLEDEMILVLLIPIVNTLIRLDEIISESLCPVEPQHDESASFEQRGRSFSRQKNNEAVKKSNGFSGHFSRWTSESSTV